MAEINPLDALLGTTSDVEEKVYIKRLNADFTVKAITGDKLHQLREQCTYHAGKGKKRTTFVDEMELSRLLVAESCVEPNFSDDRLLKHYGARDAADCVQKALLAGEVASLSDAVLDVSGFDDDEELIDEAKN